MFPVDLAASTAGLALQLTRCNHVWRSPARRAPAERRAGDGLLESGVPRLHPGPVSAEERCLRNLDLRRNTVFDIGGFQGNHALFFARSVGSSGRVISFEPHPENRAAIRAHMAPSGLTNVEIRDTAVGRRNESLEFVYPAELALGSSHPTLKARFLREKDALRVVLPVRTLDSEIADGHLPDPDFVKIDVEGMEFDVLHGMRNTVSCRKPALLVEVHGVDEPDEGANSRRVIRWLIEHRYRITHVESGQTISDREGDESIPPGQHLYCV